MCILSISSVQSVLIFMKEFEMKKLFPLALIAILGLTACGVKGPLYFPEKAEQTQTQ